jgi:hypothetical protein
MICAPAHTGIVDTKLTGAVTFGNDTGYERRYQTFRRRDLW